MRPGDSLSPLRGPLRKRWERLLENYVLLKGRVLFATRGIEEVSALLGRLHNSRHIEALLRAFHATIGERTFFKGGLVIDNASRDRDATGDFQNLVIGSRCYIGMNVFFDLPAKVIIRDEAIVSAGVKILTHADCGSRYMSRFFPRKIGNVEIGEGSWIGVNATLLCGVKIGRGSVVGAGAVVTSDVPPGVVCGGVPARELKVLGQ
ncbi:MAG: acyltransferase [Elusimicrobia bacterium]|nr:acyltransferase [Elusimicrobiota bacterium]